MRIEPSESRIEPVQGVLRASRRERREGEKQQPNEEQGECERQDREEPPAGGGLVDVRV